MIVKIFHWFTLINRRLYLSCHPQLWGKSISINGIPLIANIENIIFGKGLSLNEKVFIQGVGGVIIGNHVTLSYGCIILTSGLSTYNYVENLKNERDHENSKVEIGDGVWVGACALILPGVKISSNIIIGAGSVVTKNLDQSGWLYAGNPAKPIKRFLNDE